MCRQDVFTIDNEEEGDLGFAMYRADAAEIGVSYASRLIGRFAAEAVTAKNVNLKRGDQITEETAQAIEADDAVDGVKIMSVL